MPSFVTIHRVDTWVDDLEDQEDIDYARYAARDLESQSDHTYETLARALESIAQRVRGLRMAVRFRSEWGDDVLGSVAGAPWRPVDGELPSAVDAGTPRPSGASYGAFLRADAAARQAIDTDDWSEMLAMLDRDELAPQRADDVRHPAFREAIRCRTRAALWRALLARPRRDLDLARILQALSKEPPVVADLIAYKLYVQKHLEPELATRSPSEDAAIEQRVRAAIGSWPDFVGRVAPPAAPQKTKRDLLDRLEAGLPLIGGGDLERLAKLRRAAREATRRGSVATTRLPLSQRTRRVGKSKPRPNSCCR